MNTTTLFTVYPVVDAKLKDKNSRNVKKKTKNRRLLVTHVTRSKIRQQHNRKSGG